LKSKLMSNSAKLMSSNFVSLSADGIEEVPEPDSVLYSCIRVYVITNTAPSEHLSMGEHLDMDSRLFQPVNNFRVVAWCGLDFRALFYLFYLP